MSYGKPLVESNIKGENEQKYRRGDYTIIILAHSSTRRLLSCAPHVLVELNV